MMPVDYPTLARENLSRVRALLTRRVTPLHRHEGFRPFFIVGSGRSGNTLLRRMLEASPVVHIPPENYGLGRALEHFARNATQPWSALVSATLGIMEHANDFESFGMSLAPIAREASGWVESERSLARLVDLVYREHARLAKKPAHRWGDKTPLNSFFLPRIHAVFPEATYIHMIRDGVDCVASYVETKLIPDLERAAERWRDSVHAVEAFAAAHPGRVVDLVYEKLVAQPEPELRRICGRIGIDFAPEMIDSTSHVGATGDVTGHEHQRAVADPVSARSFGQGRRSLSPADRRRIAPIVDPTLLRLGYARAAD